MERQSERLKSNRVRIASRKRRASSSCSNRQPDRRRTARRSCRRWPRAVVQKRGELLLLPLLCGLSYAVQRLGHPFSALCPECALLVRVPLGLRPWLHRLRRRSPGFVRRLPSYYAGVELLVVVHRQLRRVELHHLTRSSSPKSRVYLVTGPNASARSLDRRPAKVAAVATGNKTARIICTSSSKRGHSGERCQPHRLEPRGVAEL
jgi:hypothetical protein